MIFNRKTNFVAMLVGNSYLVSLVNANTGNGIMVYTKNGYAVFMDIGAPITDTFPNNNLKDGSTNLLQAMKTNQPQLRSVGFQNKPDVFDFGTYVNQLYTGNEVVDVFAGKQDLKSNFSGSFENLASSFKSRVTNDLSLYNSDFTSLNILITLFGTNVGVQKVYRDVLGYTAKELGFKNTGARLFTDLYLPSLYLGGLLENEISNIKYDFGNNQFDVIDASGEIQSFVISNDGTVSPADDTGNNIAGEAYAQLDTNIKLSNDLYLDLI